MFAKYRSIIVLPGPWTAGLIVVGAAVGIRLLLTFRAGPTAFGDTAEYLEYARKLLGGRVPPVCRRMPGYPIFLIAVGGPSLNLHRVMRVQQLLGVCCNLMVFEVLRRLTGRISIAVLGGLVSVFLVDLVGWELEILSDTLGRFLVLGTIFFLVVAATSLRGWRPAILAACLLAGVAAIERPLQALLVIAVLAALLIAPELRRRASGGLIAITAILGTAPIAAVITHNWIHERFPGPATGAGFSLLDAVGHPQIYTALPPELGDIRAIYENPPGVRPSPGRFVNWSEVLGRLAQAPSAGPAPSSSGDWSDSPAWDAFATRVALRCIRAVPVGYARVWAAAMNEFLFDFKAVHGFFATGDDYARNRPQIRGTKMTIVGLLESFWKVCFPCIGVFSVILFPVIASSRGGGGGISGLGWLVFAVILATLAVNTGIESSFGQARYRVAVEDLMVILAFLAGSCPGSPALLCSISAKPR